MTWGALGGYETVPSEQGPWGRGVERIPGMDRSSTRVYNKNMLAVVQKVRAPHAMG